MRASLSRALLAVTVLAVVARADVIRVPQDYLNIQVAVNNASDGDVILIAPGDYLGTVDVDDKALSLIVDGGTARVPQIRVHDLSAGRDVLLRGLGGDGQFFTQYGPKHEGLLVTDNVGHVRVEDAAFVGGHGNNFWNVLYPPPPDHHPDGYDAVVVTDSTSVAFAHCSMLGGIGATVGNEDYQSWAGRGGHGVSADGSDVSLTQCTATGSRGGDIDDTLTYPGGDGGDGVRMTTGRLYAAASTLTGGWGGHADCEYDISWGWICGSGGDGGSGIDLGGGSSEAQLWRHGNTYHPGPGGSQGGPPGEPGLPGVDVQLRANASQAVFASTPRDVQVTSPLREGQTGALQFDGQPGDVAWVWASVAPRWEPLPAYEGVFLVDNGSVFNLLVRIAPTDPTGALTAPIVAPFLGPLEAAVFDLQGIVQTAQGSFLLGPGSALVILDAAF